MEANASIKERTATVAAEVRKTLNLTPDQYEELKYELSYEWLKRFFMPDAVRALVVSSMFQAWWAQNVAWREMNILYKLVYRDDERMEFYRDCIVSIPVHPNSLLHRRMIDEGRNIINNNPNLNNIRL